MKKIRIKITELRKIDEAKPSKDLWQIQAILLTKAPEPDLGEEEINLEDYKNSLRVRCGITVVDGLGPSQLKGDMVRSMIRIKFVPADGNPQKALRNYVGIISRIEGINRIRFLPKTLIKVEK